MVQHGGPTKMKNPVFRNITKNGKPLKKKWQTSANTFQEHKHK